MVIVYVIISVIHVCSINLQHYYFRSDYLKVNLLSLHTMKLWIRIATSFPMSLLVEHTGHRTLASLQCRIPALMSKLMRLCVPIAQLVEHDIISNIKVKSLIPNNTHTDKQHGFNLWLKAFTKCVRVNGFEMHLITTEITASRGFLHLNSNALECNLAVFIVSSETTFWLFLSNLLKQVKLMNRSVAWCATVFPALFKSRWQWICAVISKAFSGGWWDLTIWPSAQISHSGPLPKTLLALKSWSRVPLRVLFARIYEILLINALFLKGCNDITLHLSSVMIKTA